MEKLLQDLATTYVGCAELCSQCGDTDCNFNQLMTEISNLETIKLDIIKQMNALRGYALSYASDNPEYNKLWGKIRGLQTALEMLGIEGKIDKQQEFIIKEKPVKKSIEEVLGFKNK